MNAANSNSEPLNENKLEALLSESEENHVPLELNDDDFDLEEPTDFDHDDDYFPSEGIPVAACDTPANPVAAIVASTIADSEKYEVAITYNNITDYQDYILTYQTNLASDIKTVHAHHNDELSVASLLATACEFLENHAHCTDIRAKWYKSSDKPRSRTYVRVITAHFDDGEPKVIAISKPELFSLISIPNPELPSQPISTIADLEWTIEGLLVLGKLSMANNQLDYKGQVIQDTPKLLIATLSPNMPDASDYEYRTSSLTGERYLSHGSRNSHLDRYIISISSNEPIYMNLSRDSLLNFNTSVAAIKRRLNKTNAQIKKSSPKSHKLLPAMATPSQDKMWIENRSSCLLSRSAILSNADLSSNFRRDIENSLLFSNDFLEVFLAISTRSFELYISPIAPKKDEYSLLINSSAALSYPVHLTSPTFLFSLPPAGFDRSLKDMPDIRGLISKGLFRQEFYTCDWNEDNQCFNLAKGFLDGVSSFWLYWLMVNTYFNCQPINQKTLEAGHTLGNANPSCSDLSVFDDCDTSDDDFKFDDPDYIHIDFVEPDDYQIDILPEPYVQPDPEPYAKYKPYVKPKPLDVEPDVEPLDADSENITDFHDYILVCQNSNSEEINTICASNADQQGIHHLIATATQFLEDTLSCTDIRMMTFEHVGGGFAYFKVFTARIGLDESKVIAISNSAPLASGEIALDYPRKINRICELESVIAGLVLFGYLSADADYLVSCDKALSDIPKILIATLSPKSLFLPYSAYPTYASSQAPFNPKDKYIVRMVSNDPIYMEISKTSRKVFSASVIATRRRLKTIKNDLELISVTDNKPMPDLPDVVEAKQGNVWLLDTSADLKTQDSLIRNKTVIPRFNELRASLLLSNEFLEAFLLLSNRSIDLSISAISNSEEYYSVSVSRKPVGDASDTKPLHFLPEPLFDVFLNAANPIRYDIRSLIADGLYSHSFLSSVWHNAGWRGFIGYFDNVSGTLDGHISHWLYLLMINTYFNIDVLLPILARPKVMLSSPPIGEVSFCPDSDQTKTLALDLKGMDFVVGHPIFEVDYYSEGKLYSCSVFSSPRTAGVLIHKENFTAIYFLEGVVFHIHSAMTLVQITTSLLDRLSVSDEAVISNLDVFDVMRDVVGVARQAAGFELKPALFSGTPT